jgi:hypothetical protein
MSAPALARLQGHRANRRNAENLAEIGSNYNVSGWTISGFAHTYAKNAHF